MTARHILYSVFFDNNPKGFGLIQRERRFEAYQDIGAGYQDRPSAWVEPKGEWGEGSVDLIELPTGTEYADNIVAFWRPKDPLQPGGDYNYAYRLTWLYQAPAPVELAKIVQTRVGEGLAPGSRFLLIDFAGGNLAALAEEEMWDFDVHASAGYIKAYSVVPHPFIDGKRIGIEYYPDGDKVADLSFQIRQHGDADQREMGLSLGAVMLPRGLSEQGAAARGGGKMCSGASPPDAPLKRSCVHFVFMHRIYPESTHTFPSDA